MKKAEMKGRQRLAELKLVRFVELRAESFKLIK